MGFMPSTKKVSLLTGDQKRLLRDLTGQIRGEIGQSGPVYGGQITPDETYAQRLAFNAAPGILQQSNAPTSAISSMLQGQSAIGVDPEQYYPESIYAPAKLAYDDAVKQLESRYGGSWGQTGAYQDIMQENAARFGVGLGAQLSDLAYTERDVANQQRAAGVDASFGQTRNLADTYQTLLGVGGEQRSIEGQQSAEAYNKWQASQDYNNPWLGFLGPALGTQAFAIQQDQGWGRGFKPLSG